MSLPTRRERVRAATLDEIRQTARQLLVDEGAAGVSLRAIGREMGMTAAALYRYFPSLDALMMELCARLYDECREHLELTLGAAPPGDPKARLFAVCRAFRTWAIDHPAEFTLMFNSPTEPAPAHGETPSEPHLAGMRFSQTFARLFAEVWAHRPFPVTADDEIAPALYRQLSAFVDAADFPLPVGAAVLFLSCWIRLYGIVTMEVHGHLHFALSDAEPMFESELADCGRLLGLDRLDL